MQKNWEKIVLAIAVLILLAGLFVGYRTLASAPTEPPKPTGKGTIPQAAEVDASKASQKFASQDSWASPKLPSGESLDLFVSRTVIVPQSDASQTIVMTDPASTPLHDPIPNTWWISHSIDSYMTSNAKEQDQDKDGFSNLEEYEGDTNPSDPTSHPDVTNKLALENIEASTRFFEFHQNTANAVGIRAMQQAGTRYRPIWSGLGPLGQAVGPNKPEDQKTRYQLEDVKGEGKEATITVRDTQATPGSRNETFELPYREVTPINDYTAVFRYKLPGGQDPIEVPEGQNFSLPGVTDKSYRLVSIDPTAETALIEVLDSAGAVTNQLTIGKRGPQ